MTPHVRYLEKTREYYLSEGYKTPYRWAHFDDVPFTPLRKPLSECRVGLVTTGEVALRGVKPDRAEEDSRRNVYLLPTDTPIEQLYSRKESYDRYATTLDDVDSYLPLTRLRELVTESRIGSLAPRFQNVYSHYSQRKTLSVDAPEVLRQCLEDTVDALLLVAI
jgi:hypothetical protein